MRPLHTQTCSLVSSVILIHHITVIRLHNWSTCFEGTCFLPQEADVSIIMALLCWTGGPGTSLRLYLCVLYLNIWSRQHHFPLHDDAVRVLLPCLYIPPTGRFLDFPWWELNFYMHQKYDLLCIAETLWGNPTYESSSVWKFLTYHEADIFLKSCSYS